MLGTSIIQNLSMAPSMNYFLMVTIVEIHMMIHSSTIMYNTSNTSMFNQRLGSEKIKESSH